jgi:coenzyme F420-0:L-glutamate ligase/coenzyme F420-1:gamma-L-glutamate ligase
MICARALEGVPEVRPGDDLAALLAAARGGRFDEGEVLVIAHKVVSKAEGRVVRLEDVEPSPRALELAAELGKDDPRHVEVVLRETAEIVRAQRGVLICRTRHGFVCANAGVDASNAGADGELILLPEDPDGSARRLRAELREAGAGAPAVVIADSFGRAWRHGQCDVAIGIAGLAPLQDWRGLSDRRGRELHATWIAVADQAAAAADLARGGKDAGHPAVVITGLERHVSADDGPGAAALVRPRDEDLFT